MVNGKSTIEWIVERYCVSTDKKSLIKNDCNDWALEHHQNTAMFADGVFHCHYLRIFLTLSAVKDHLDVREIGKPVIFLIDTATHILIQ
ncbi:type ISP restriction/modification enzyme [Prevotella brunnea]|uniref:type ISP restriction/modification enzyme n=1 Tax=Prevotella brunnea TaxID=2508867 RepID=UPI0035E3DF9C